MANDLLCCDWGTSTLRLRTNEIFRQLDKHENLAYLSGSELRSPVKTGHRVILCNRAHVFEYYKQAAGEIKVDAIGITAEMMERTAAPGQLAIFDQVLTRADVPTAP